MHVIFKLSVLLLCFVVCKTEEEVLKCNLKYCGAELLNFEKFTFRVLFRKLELANFCVKNCTPTAVQEFFQSIIYSITKRIPGQCSGTDCIDKNRFVALAKCVEDEAWSLLQCSKTLIDLAHIGLVTNPQETKLNTTCKIITETVQCIEETLQNCGETPFQLVKEILGRFITYGINGYCHPSYRHEGWFLKRTTSLTVDPSLPTTTEDPDYRHPQFVKGYRRQGDDASFVHLSHACMFLSLMFSIILSVHYIH